jgi:hypothetical protein
VNSRIKAKHQKRLVFVSRSEVEHAFCKIANDCRRKSGMSLADNAGVSCMSKQQETDMSKSKLVTGLFTNRVAAESAVDAILKRGYSRDDVSVLMSDATRSKEFALQTRTHAVDGAGIGGAVGGAIGAVLAAVVAVGTTLFLPGINLVIAGPIAAALAGAGAGGATGGLIGGLIGAGIPEHRAKVYETGIRGGGILLGVEAKTDDEVEKLEQLLEDVGAQYVRAE